MGRLGLTANVLTYVCPYDPIFVRFYLVSRDATLYYNFPVNNNKCNHFFLRRAVTRNSMRLISGLPNETFPALRGFYAVCGLGRDECLHSGGV